MTGLRHQCLRDATGSIHAEVEHVVERAHYFASPERYAVYLARMHLFYRSFLASCYADGRAELHAWRIEDRIGYLQADLDDLGHMPLPAEASADWRKPDLACGTAVTGALYVVIGSTLGARVLLRHANNLPLPEGVARRYFTELANSGTWPRFLKHLEAAPPDTERLLAGAAIATFVSIMDHLSEAIPA